MICENYPNPVKFTWNDTGKQMNPGLNLGPHYLIIVDQIQVKLVSIQTYLGKVLVQSIVAPLDFPLSS